MFVRGVSGDISYQLRGKLISGVFGFGHVIGEVWYTDKCQFYHVYQILTWKMWPLSWPVTWEFSMQLIVVFRLSYPRKDSDRKWKLGACGLKNRNLKNVVIFSKREGWPPVTPLQKPKLQITFYECGESNLERRRMEQVRNRNGFGIESTN